MEWRKVSGNNVIARHKKGGGVILVADGELSSQGFFISMLPPIAASMKWSFLCLHKNDDLRQLVGDDELVEFVFGNTRIRANPSKGWVHLLRK